MKVGRVCEAGSVTLWQAGDLQLAVQWQYGLPLYLVSFPWPGDDAGVLEPLGAEAYLTWPAADAAARAYIAGLPGD